MKVMSFNIWSDAPNNRSWLTRRDRIADVLRREDLAIVGLQEATASMVHDLQERLPQFQWVGAGRDDGDRVGEYTPIFYRADRFSLVEHGHFWLAEACDRPGRGWDAMCCRIVTWARLAEKDTGHRVTHFNTHLDHLGRRARKESALLLLRKIHELAGPDPAILTGDFNCRESSAPYLLLTGRLPFSAQGPSEFSLRDTRYDSAHPPAGPAKTYRGLLSLLGLGRIDYIFIKNGLQTLRHEVLEEAAGASDHRPILAEVSILSPAESALTATNETAP